MTWPEDLPTHNLAIQLQKLAKDISFHQSKRVREVLLREAARRLINYRQAERLGKLTVKEQDGTLSEDRPIPDIEHQTPSEVSNEK